MLVSDEAGTELSVKTCRYYPALCRTAWIAIHYDVLTSRQNYVTISMDTDEGYSVSKDQPSKKNTSLRLESNMLKALKIRAIEEDTSVQVILERLVDEYLNNSKKKNKSKK